MVKIGGLQPVTLLDYPGKMAAIIFTLGCNMRCPFCYNPNLVLPEMIRHASILSNTELLSFLKRRKKYLDGVVITGGEPLLQKGIITSCQRIKKMGYLIKLDTNGLRPDVLKQLLDKKLIDYLAMDIKGPLDQYQKFAGVPAKPEVIALSIALVMASGLPYEFRSTLVKSLHKQSDLRKMARMIKKADLYYLQNFKSDTATVGGDPFKGHSFTRKEMEQFRTVASKYVKECKVR